MKLSEYAKLKGVSYKTAWRWFKNGQLDAEQMDTGTVVVRSPFAQPHQADRTAVYARVSSAENKSNLDTQAERVTNYCAAKGYQVALVIKEVGSGVNDQRPKFLKLLADPTITRIVVEHKDRATQFGFQYLKTLLATQGRTIEVINLAENGKDDLVQDFVSVITSFCARLYGQRRAKRKTEKLLAELTKEK